VDTAQLSAHRLEKWPPIEVVPVNHFVYRGNLLSTTMFLIESTLFISVRITYLKFTLPQGIRQRTCFLSR
jgi:hypothetical protein